MAAQPESAFAPEPSRRVAQECKERRREAETPRRLRAQRIPLEGAPHASPARIDPVRSAVGRGMLYIRTYVAYRRWPSGMGKVDSGALVVRLPSLIAIVLSGAASIAFLALVLPVPAPDATQPPPPSPVARNDYEVAWTPRPQRVTQDDRFRRLDAAQQPEASPLALRATLGRPANIEDSVTIIALADGGPVRIRLAGVEGMRLDQICVADTGARTACGSQARAAINHALSDRTIECQPVQTLTDGIVAECYLGNTRIASWLVREGYALPTGAAADSFNEELRLARRARRGFWSDHDPRRLVIATGEVVAPREE
jgi:endonuclease YncB( thermonuclease family)